MKESVLNAKTGGFMDNLFVPFNAKVGRPRKFATPQALLKAFHDYLEDRKSRPLWTKETESGYIGESTMAKAKEKMKNHPLSIVDFCVYLGCSRNWWNELPSEFLGVKSRIADYIFSYQLKGAETGEFNANIVARELGLADKKELTGESINIIVNSPEEREKIEGMKDLQI